MIVWKCSKKSILYIISSEMSATANFHFAFKLPSLTSVLSVYLASILENLPAPFKMMSCFSLIFSPNWCNNDLLRTDTCAALSTTTRNLFELIKISKVQNFCICRLLIFKTTSRMFKVIELSFIFLMPFWPL